MTESGQTLSFRVVGGSAVVLTDENHAFKRADAPGLEFTWSHPDPSVPDGVYIVAAADVPSGDHLNPPPPLTIKQLITQKSVGAVFTHKRHIDDEDVEVLAADAERYTIAGHCGGVLCRFAR